MKCWIFFSLFVSVCLETSQTNYKVISGAFFGVTLDGNFGKVNETTGIITPIGTIGEKAYLGTSTSVDDAKQLFYAVGSLQGEGYHGCLFAIDVRTGTLAKTILLVTKILPEFQEHQPRACAVDPSTHDVFVITHEKDTLHFLRVTPSNGTIQKIGERNLNDEYLVEFGAYDAKKNVFWFEIISVKPESILSTFFVGIDGQSGQIRHNVETKLFDASIVWDSLLSVFWGVNHQNNRYIYFSFDPYKNTIDEKASISGYKSVAQTALDTQSRSLFSYFQLPGNGITPMVFVEFDLPSSSVVSTHASCRIANCVKAIQYLSKD